MGGLLYLLVKIVVPVLPALLDQGTALLLLQELRPMRRRRVRSADTRYCNPLSGPRIRAARLKVCYILDTRLLGTSSAYERRRDGCQLKLQQPKRRRGCRHPSERVK